MTIALEEKMYSRTNIATPISDIEAIIKKIIDVYRSGNVEPTRVTDQEYDDLEFITGGYIYSKNNMTYKLKRIRYPKYSLVFIGKYSDE
jgi:hypothetical protein